MATEVMVPKQMVMADLKGKVDPDWCPGCGDFGVLAAVQKALVELQIPKHEVATISGIGCSSNFPGFIDTYGMHTLHGRSLPVATGMKLANHAMTVLVTGGDGDGFGIGAGHFVHAMRRNVDLTLHRDGQPDLRPHHRADLAHQPPRHEDQEHALRQYRNPAQPHLACARGGSDIRRARLQRRAEAPDRADQARHPAQGLLVYRRLQPLRHLQPRQHLPVVPSAGEEARGQSGVRPTDWSAAMEKSLLWGDEIPIGMFFERTDLPALARGRAGVEARPARPAEHSHSRRRCQVVYR